MSGRYRFAVADTPDLRRLPWEAMEAEGLTRAVLWNRERPTLYDWLDLVSPERTLMGVAFDDERDGDLAGALWVIPMGLCGTAHFVVFRRWRPDAARLGSEAVDWIFRTWPLESLLALYPAAYRHVRKFVDDLGFEAWPERIPAACHMPTERNPTRCVDAALALLRRDAVCGGREGQLWAGL